MTQHSARASVALQMDSSPMSDILQLNQNIVYILFEDFQCIHSVNTLVFRMKIFAEMTIRWQVPYGSSLRYRPTLCHTTATRMRKKINSLAVVL